MSGCSVAGCVRERKKRTWCETHYMRWYRHGDVDVSLLQRDHPETCTVDGCEMPWASRGLCSMHWQRFHKTGDPGPVERRVERYPAGAVCAVAGCGRRPRRHWLCEMHADRLDDRGAVGSPDPQKAPSGAGNIRPDGYVDVTRPGHPLAGRRGRVLLHRVVLYDDIGPGVHACRWCGIEMVWTTDGLVPGALVVDHVDFNPSNNVIENLVPSCHPCNSARHAR